MPTTEGQAKVKRCVKIGRNIVTIQHILPRSATLGLMLFHEIWIPTLKKQR
jgi:hypothetical protein